MSVVEPGEVVKECMFQKGLSPTTRQLHPKKQWDVH